jgi:CheY-like chemotaxis protein
LSQLVLDVGNCAPDHAAVKRLLTTHFDVVVQQASHLTDAVAALRNGEFALVLVNRKLDVDYSDGIEVIRALKNDAQLRSVPAMLVTNYTEHQQLAVDAGALPGFGKLEFETSYAVERLAAALGSPKLQ